MNNLPERRIVLQIGSLCQPHTLISSKSYVIFRAARSMLHCVIMRSDLLLLAQ